jgi:hypothetical protein
LVFDGFGEDGPIVGGAEVVVGGADVVGGAEVVGGGGSAFLLMPAGSGNGITLLPSRAAFM